MMILVVHFTSDIGTVKTKVQVNTLAEAAREFCIERDGGNFGASAMRGKCGDVHSDLGKKIAHVHYNGRVEQL